MPRSGLASTSSRAASAPAKPSEWLSMVSLLALVLLSGTAEANEAWKVEELSFPRQDLRVVDALDLALDKKGRPHLVVAGEGPSRKSVALYVTAGRKGWTSETAIELPAGEVRSLACFQAAIALTRGKPTIAFNASKLVLARRGRRGWTRETLLEERNEGSPELDLAVAGNVPYVFFHSAGSDPTVLLAHGSSSRAQWLGPDSKNANDSFGGGALAVLGKEAHAVWAPGGRSSSKRPMFLHARSEGGPFEAPTAVVGEQGTDLGPRVGASTEELFVLTSELLPGKHALYLSTLRRGKWRHKTVGHFGGRGFDVVDLQLAIAKDGTPHVLLVCGGSKHSIYHLYRHKDESWRLSLVTQSAGAARRDVRLAVGKDGRPRVVLVEPNRPGPGKVLYATLKRKKLPEGRRVQPEQAATTDLTTRSPTKAEWSGTAGVR